MRLYHLTNREIAERSIENSAQEKVVWLVDVPQAFGAQHKAALGIDVNVSERELREFEQMGSDQRREFLVPARWIARHGTVYSAALKAG